MARKELARGFFWEDFAVGDEFVTLGRTVGESTLETFSGLTGDFSDVHTDEEAMRLTEFGGRIGHAILGLGILQGLMWQTGYNLGTAVATLGWESLRWPRPLRIGDTVQGRWTISSTRASASKRGMGIIVEDCELRNQHDEAVLTGQHVLLLRRRPGVEGAPVSG